MKKMLLGLVMVVLFLSACASPVDAPVAEKEPEISVFQKAQDGKPIKFVGNDSGHPFYLMAIAGFVEACDDYGLLCELVLTEDQDEAKVLTMAEAIKAEDTSGVSFVLNNASRYPAGYSIIDQGIPLVAWHTAIPPNTVRGLLARVGPNPVEYSLEAGRAGAEKVGCDGPAVISMSGMSDMENTVADNMEAGFGEVCPDTEFLPRIAVGSGDDAKGISSSSALLQSNPDVSIAFSTTNDGARWWALSAQEVGIEKGKVAIVGMDATRANLDLIKSGDVWMLVGQPVFEENYYVVVLLVNHLLGYPVPYNSDLPAPQVTLENVDDFYAILEKVDALKSR